MANEIERMIERLSSPQLMHAIGQEVLRQTLDRWDTHIDPDGNEWEALSARTIAARRRGRRASSNVEILRNTSNMKNAVDYEVVSPTEVDIGVANAIDYAKYHHGRDGELRGNRIPRRRFLGINAENLREIDDRIQEFLDEE